MASPSSSSSSVSGKKPFHVSLLFRHGARAPSGNAYKTFEGSEGVRNRWKNPHGEGAVLEMLTPVGFNQSFQLGQYFATELKRGRFFEPVDSINADRIKWRSSITERVQASAACFWKGFEPSGSVIKRVYEDEDPTDTTDSHIRPWTDKQYSAWSKSILGGVSDQELAAKHDQFLDTIKQRYNVPSKYPNPMILNGLPYVHELLECELYLIPSQIDLLSNDIPQDNSLIIEKPLFAASNSVTSLTLGLSLEEADLTENLSRTIWYQRFCTPDAKKHLGPKLLKEFIVDVFDQKPKEEITIVSCHDYTILVTLGSIAYPSYPERVLSFSSYLIVAFFEADEDFPSENYARLYINTCPFLLHSESDVTPSASILPEHEEPLLCPVTNSFFWPLSHFRSCLDFYSQ